MLCSNEKTKTSLQRFIHGRRGTEFMESNERPGGRLDAALASGVKAPASIVVLQATQASQKFAIHEWPAPPKFSH
jgi:hypothetical protein